MELAKARVICMENSLGKFLYELNAKFDHGKLYGITFSKCNPIFVAFRIEACEKFKCVFEFVIFCLFSLVSLSFYVQLRFSPM